MFPQAPLVFPFKRFFLSDKTLHLQTQNMYSQSLKSFGGTDRFFMKGRKWPGFHLRYQLPLPLIFTNMPPDSPGTVNGHELNVNIGEYRERERVNELNTLGVFSHEQPMSITPKLMTNPEINLSSCCCWLVLTVCCCCSGARNQGCTGTLCLPVTLAKMPVNRRCLLTS